MNQSRLDRVAANMDAQGLSQIIVSSTASVYYLTGFWVEPMERMLALLIRADGRCTLFANELFGLSPQPGSPTSSCPESWAWTKPGPANF